MLKSLWPTWWDAIIGPIEREAEERGVHYCRWGGRDKNGERGFESRAASDFEFADDAGVGVMCSDCELRLDVEGATS